MLDLEEIEIEGDSGKTETWNPQSEDGGADGWSGESCAAQSL